MHPSIEWMDSCQGRATVFLERGWGIEEKGTLTLYYLALVFFFFLLALVCSLNAMAIACLRDFTTGPPLPACNVPVLYSCITFSVLVFLVAISSPTFLMPTLCGLVFLWSLSLVLACHPYVHRTICVVQQIWVISLLVWLRLVV